jgi:hypothetical protein
MSRTVAREIAIDVIDEDIAALRASMDADRSAGVRST